MEKKILKKRKVEDNGNKSHQNRPSKISYAVVTSSDMKKSIEFYTKMFGFHLKMEMPGWVELIGTENGTILGLTPQSKSGSLHLAIEVNSLEKYHNEITQHSGVVCQESPKREHGIFRSSYTCPDGAFISVLEEMKLEKTGNGICHIEIPCDNFERVKKFYGEIFGWTFTDAGEYLLFKCNDSAYTIAGTFFISKERYSFVPFHLNVDHIQSLLDKIKTSGGSIDKEKFEMAHIGFFAYFKDCEGNTLSLYSKSGN